MPLHKDPVICTIFEREVDVDGDGMADVVLQGAQVEGRDVLAVHRHT